MQLGDEAVLASALLDAGGLAPRGSRERAVQLTAAKLSVTDGPSAEAKVMVRCALSQVRSSTRPRVNPTLPVAAP